MRVVQRRPGAALPAGPLQLGPGAVEQFLPPVFAELGVPIQSVSVAKPTLDDVFMSYTGRTIRDAEAANPLRQMVAAFRRR